MSDDIVVHPKIGDVADRPVRRSAPLGRTVNPEAGSTIRVPGWIDGLAVGL